MTESLDVRQVPSAERRLLPVRSEPLPRPLDARRARGRDRAPFPITLPASFDYRSPSHPPVRVHLVVPSSCIEATQIVFVMHGVLRNAEEYAAR